MQVQCIESDLKLIYAGMQSGDFEENLDMLEKANLGTVIKKLKDLDRPSFIREYFEDEL